MAFCLLHAAVATALIGSSRALLRAPPCRLHAALIPASGVLRARLVCCAGASPPSAPSPWPEEDEEPLQPLTLPPTAGGAPIEARCVYYVSTPIGNLEDITLRAVRTLREVDVVASEDTRVTGGLLRHLGIGRKQLVAHHDHNLGASVPKLLQLLEGGASVAVVSDAGTPGISDPGLALAAECARRGFPVVPVPGPCAAVAAVSVSGFAATEFVFGGFLPRGGRTRRQRVAELASERRAVVLYEAPHRMLETLGDLIEAGAAEREVVCAREITKLHEEFHRGTVASARAWYASVVERDGKLRGEFTVVIAPIDAATLELRRGEAAADAEGRAAEAVRVRLAAGGAISRVAKEVALEFGVAKAKVYAEALRQKEEAKGHR